MKKLLKKSRFDSNGKAKLKFSISEILGDKQVRKSRKINHELNHHKKSLLPNTDAWYTSIFNEFNSSSDNSELRNHFFVENSPKEIANECRTSTFYQASSIHQPTSIKNISGLKLFCDEIFKLIRLNYGLNLR